MGRPQSGREKNTRFPGHRNVEGLHICLHDIPGSCSQTRAVGAGRFLKTISLIMQIICWLPLLLPDSFLSHWKSAGTLAMCQLFLPCQDRSPKPVTTACSETQAAGAVGPGDDVPCPVLGKECPLPPQQPSQVSQPAFHPSPLRRDYPELCQPMEGPGLPTALPGYQWHTPA